MGSSTSGSTGDCDIVDPILVNRKTWHYLCITGMCQLIVFVIDVVPMKMFMSIIYILLCTYVIVSLDDGTPMYFIQKILATKGWKPGKAPLQHTAESELKFGAKMHQCVAKRAYLQCLVTVGTLREHGLEALPSGQQQGYYKSVLASKFPATVKVSQKADYYKALLKKEHADSDRVPSNGIRTRSMLKRGLGRLPNTCTPTEADPSTIPAVH